jgi:hypothetical protein
LDHVIAVRLITDAGDCYFLTWGRIQHPVEPGPVEALIFDAATRFALPGRPVRAQICATLGDARDAPLFYEALVSFAQKPIPFGRRYEAWRRATDAAMRQGQEIFAAGPFGPGSATPAQ